VVIAFVKVWLSMQVMIWVVWVECCRSGQGGQRGRRRVAFGLHVFMVAVVVMSVSV